MSKGEVFLRIHFGADYRNAVMVEGVCEQYVFNNQERVGQHMYYHRYSHEFRPRNSCTYVAHPSFVWDIGRKETLFGVEGKFEYIAKCSACGHGLSAYGLELLFKSPNFKGRT